MYGKLERRLLHSEVYFPTLVTTGKVETTRSQRKR